MKGKYEAALEQSRTSSWYFQEYLQPKGGIFNVCSGKVGKAGQTEGGQSRGAALEEVKTKVKKRGSTDAKINEKIRADKSSRL